MTFLLLFYYILRPKIPKFNKKKRMSNQKSGMVLEVTFILNSKMNIVTKFQVPILKNGEVRGGLL